MFLNMVDNIKNRMYYKDATNYHSGVFLLTFVKFYFRKGVLMPRKARRESETSYFNVIVGGYENKTTKNPKKLGNGKIKIL